METTRSSDPTRTGAVWVTATGSFLLFAAAVTLVAVRWDHIPDGMKLGALALLSGGLLIAGRPGSALADRHAPAAADVLFHLGAFLAPVTASAVLIHLEVPRDVQLLTLGAASTALFHVLGRLERSVVLEWATLAATVVATAGLGGLTPVPATAWLVALAAGGLVAGRHREAVAWSALATIVPLAALGGRERRPGVGAVRLDARRPRRARPDPRLRRPRRRRRAGRPDPPSPLAAPPGPGHDGAGVRPRRHRRGARARTRPPGGSPPPRPSR